MPPAGKGRPEKTTDASGVGSTDTGEPIAGDTANTGTQATKPSVGPTTATAIDEFKDKYFDCLPFRETPGSSKITDRNKLVVGSLKRHIKFWENINAENFILSTIREGYKIPFYETPHSAYFKNNKSAMAHGDFVSKEIKNLLDTGRIRQLSRPPTVVNPLSVATNGSKPRLILDLRYINTHLWSQHVKYEDFRTFRHYLTDDAFMFSFDLKSGYHHIEIFEEHWQYLGFSWTEDGITRFYVFLVLPFGLATAGYIFTKVCRVLVKFWRSLGIKIVMFLDDGIGIAETEENCREIAHIVKSSIDDSGFVSNEEKSIWDPTQCLIWLGLVINTHPLRLLISPKRIKKLAALSESALDQVKVSARQISAIAGSIRSQEVVLGQISSLFTRNMNNFIATSASWDAKREISKGVIDELQFWKVNMDRLNMKALDRSDSAPAHLTLKVNSDASDHAAGAVLTLGGISHYAHKSFSPTEAALSSTWRELEAIRFSLGSFKSLLRNKTVVWATDNDPAVKIMSKGSRKPHLHTLAVSIYFICRESNIDFHPVWLPRDFNCVADALSKTIDFDDWTTTRDFFNYIEQLWGPFSIDRFASDKNSKTVRFNTKYWNPNSEAVDAFSQDWAHDCNWLVPPVHLICRSILHAKRCHAAGALLVPLWSSAAYWPMLFTDDRKPQPWVQETITFHNTSGILQLGDYKGSLLGSSRFRSPLVMIRFRF